MGYQI